MKKLTIYKMTCFTCGHSFVSLDEDDAVRRFNAHLCDPKEILFGQELRCRVSRGSASIGDNCN